MLLGMAVGWQRRVTWWYLGSLRAEPPLICRRMCFNRKNKSCLYLRSLAPAGAKSQRRLAGSGHRQRPGSVTPWVGGSCASPVQPGGVGVQARGSSASPVLQCDLCSGVRQRSEPAPPRPRRSRLRAALQPLLASPAARGRPAVCL